jgi:membrane fusion protein, multidrug efflux system
MNDAPDESITTDRPDQLSRSHRHGARPMVRLLIVLMLLGAAGSGLVYFHRLKAGILKGVVTQITSQLPTVATVKAAAQDWQPALTATGTLRASSGADLSAEIGGIVGELHFQSGQDVAAGDLLVRLRPNDDDARLQELQATADLDEITYQRDLKQFRAQGVAQATVDTDAGNLKNARAQVAAQQALMAEKFIRAPFAGRLGVRQVDVGQYLSAGTTVVTLQALDPIFADFYLPQQALAEVKVGQAATVHADTYPGRDFAGTVLAINPKVDPASRMVQVRATLRNADDALLPGMYVTVSVAAGVPQKAVTLPNAAVAYNSFGSLVYKVRQTGTDAEGKPKLTVQQQFVTAGATRGDQIEILKGVADGDEVVVAGQLKLRNNMGVLVNNSVVPTDDPAPTPHDQ